MKKLILTTLSVVCLSSISAMATDIPYVFTPHTPAKASEVNANFQALLDKIDTLEQNAGNGSGSSGNIDEGCSFDSFEYTYHHISSNIGDTVTINGKEYIISAIPFVEYGTGERYYIKYPVLRSMMYADMFSTTGVVSTSYVTSDAKCYKDTIAGYPAWKYTTYSTTYSASLNGDSGSFTATVSAMINVTFKINKTALNVYIVDYTQPKQLGEISANDYDMRDNVNNWSDLDLNSTVIDGIKTLMNYVEIYKM